MTKEMLGQVSRERCLLAGFMGLLLVWVSGCASEPPKPSGATITPDQVRSHADKGFEKLKQEEQLRNGSPTTAP